MDISVFSKYIEDMKRVYPAVEGRIMFRNSAIFPARSLGLLLLGLYLALALWLTSCTALSFHHLQQEMPLQGTYSIQAGAYFTPKSWDPSLRKDWGLKETSF